MHRFFYCFLFIIVFSSISFSSTFDISELVKKPKLLTWNYLGGGVRFFRESYVDGSQGNCGFTAIGLDREEAIELLIKNADNEKIRWLMASEIKALVTDPEEKEASSAYMLPAILQELRQLFYNERNQLVEHLEAQRMSLNTKLDLTGSDGLTLKAAQSYMCKHADQYEWGQGFIDNFQRLQQIDEEMERFIPTQEQIVAFVVYEFGDRHGYVSYFRGGGGTLEALARIKRIELHVFEGDLDLVQTLYVSPQVNNPHKYFLHHVGGVDSKGRIFLNHFNLLEEVTDFDAERDPKDNLEKSVIDEVNSLVLIQEEKFQKIIKEIGMVVGGRGRTCFINRAWGREGEEAYDDFALRLNKDLKSTGIITIFDVEDLDFGDNIQVFMNKIGTANFVAAIFTPRYKERCQYSDTFVRLEANKIVKRLDRDSDFYIPILLAGTSETSIPVGLDPKGILHFDFRGDNYYSYFFDILEQKLLTHLRPPVIEGLPVAISYYREKFFNNGVSTAVVQSAINFPIFIDKVTLREIEAIKPFIRSNFLEITPDNIGSDSRNDRKSSRV